MDPSSNSPKQSSGCRNGCLITLVVLLVLVIVGGVVTYHLLFSTSMPFRLIASAIEKANPSVHIEGIEGDFKTGLSVASIKWGDVPETPSEIADLRIRYNGYEDAGKTHRLVINDVGVSRAHIDLADLPSDNGATTTQTMTVTNSNGTTTQTSTTTTYSSGGATYTTTSGANAPNPFAGVTGAGFPQGLDSVEVQRVSILDVLITNRTVPDFRISIPKIEWTGFKATPNSFEPGVLTIESDRLTVHTAPGRTVPVEGENITFQKSITGEAQPALHPAIKQPISFSADATFLPQGGNMRPFHFVAVDGKLEINESKDGNGAIHARQLDLAGLIDPKKLFGEQTADLPSDLTINAVVAAAYETGSGTAKIVDGSFRLGKATFEIQPLEFSKAAAEHINLKAIAKTDAGQITWSLPIANFAKEYHPRLSGTGISQSEILAQVFMGKPYDQLGDEEKKAIDARLLIYFAPEEKKEPQ